MNKIKILIVFIILMIFNFLPHSLLWGDGGPPIDLIKAIDNCNRTKVNREHGYATDDQLDSAVETVRQLLEAGADPNMRIPNYTVYIPGYGDSAWYMDGEITLLMLSRVAKASELLIEYGARVNDRDNYGRTALMFSAFFDHFYNDNNLIFKTLLDNGAIVNIQNNTGQTALHYSIYRANLEAIALLINNGANVNMSDNKGWSPLVAANIRYFGDSRMNDEIIQILIDAGAMFSDTDRQLINSLKEKYIWWDDELNMNSSSR
jgi:ankyrin repeat protein